MSSSSSDHESQEDIACSSSSSSRYQHCTLGRTLLTSLKNLVNEGEMSTDQAIELMSIFDESVDETMKQVFGNEYTNMEKCSASIEVKLLSEGR